ncbi:MAG: PEGA domain-containing protein [Deltaproteobacteria bacterium]|jgi:hypothetical protein|nr:PEGA domain-containing protein [Deltaproteobacteria bacterium]MBW2530970.1 PEGA domain-containing protein [Deltaproteobacteria bacterium]
MKPFETNRTERHAAWTPRAIAALVAIACALGVAMPARSNPAAAKAHFDQALAHIDRREYRKAVAELQQAYEIQPHYSVLFNLRQAHVLLDEPVEAIARLEQYLEDGGTAVSTDRVEEVRQTLEQQRKLVGELVVQARPAGATIAVDGRELGSAPLASPVLLRTGRHLVQAELTGHLPSEQWVDVVNGRAAVVDLALTRQPPHRDPSRTSGQLEVHCPIPGVAVHVDDRPVATTPLGTTIFAEPGHRSVRFERPGYRFSPRQVTLTRATVVGVDCIGSIEDPLPAALASRLKVHTTPEGVARIDVDGAPANPSMELPAGPHRVVVTLVGHEPWARDVRLSPGRTSEVHAELSPTASYVEAQRTRSTTQRIIALVVGGAGVALAAVTVGHFVWNDGRHEDWSEEDDELQRQWSDEVPRSDDLAARQASNDELLRSVFRADAVTVGLGVGAGALLVTGAALLLTGDDPGDYQVVAAPLASGGALILRGLW